MTSLQFLVGKAFKSVYADFWAINYSLTLSKRPKLWLIYPYKHGRYSDELHTIVPLVLSFAVKTCPDTFTGTNSPHYLLISLVRRKLQLHGSFASLATLRNKLSIGCFFPVTIILSPSSLGLKVTSRTWPHKLQILPPLVMHIQHYSVTIYLDWLLELILGEKNGKKETSIVVKLMSPMP